MVHSAGVFDKATVPKVTAEAPPQNWQQAARIACKTLPIPQPGPSA